MQKIPILETPAQTFSVTLGGQPCDIALYQKSTGLYMDLSVSGSKVLVGVICENLNRIVRNTYLKFNGDLMFQDLQGTSDPYYGGGLGTRFLLCYIEATDLWGVT